MLYLFGNTSYMIHQGKEDLVIEIPGGATNRHALEGLEIYRKNKSPEAAMDYLKEMGDRKAAGLDLEDRLIR